jgi:hypothetical protein
MTLACGAIEGVRVATRTKMCSLQPSVATCPLQLMARKCLPKHFGFQLAVSVVELGGLATENL